ncbi:MAG: hypothetical protein IPM53_06760 [Anaerolineaceae bacterium]|nr:hypothetical protein [Anaerolineaceae bacterium]
MLKPQNKPYNNFKITPYRILIAIIILSIISRVGNAFMMGNVVSDLPGIFDQISYHNLALRVLDGHGFSFGEFWWPGTAANEPTAHWSYLYTLYLAAVYALFGPNPLIARLIQAVTVGILMPWLVYRLALHLFPQETRPEGDETFGRGEKIGLLSAGIVVIYIYFIYYAAALLTESFYITTILWLFDLTLQMRRSTFRHQMSRWIWLGVALGLTVLLRQVFLLFIPFLLFWLWWALRPKLAYLVVPVLVVVLMIVPWTVRNYLAFGQFVILNTNAGYAFFWGNHTIYGTNFVSILTPEMGSYYSLVPEELRHLNEAQRDTALLGLALKNISADPVRYLLLSLSRVQDYFMFWPSTQSSLLSNISRVASFGLFLPWMLYGLFFSIRHLFLPSSERVASPLFLFYLFIIIYTGIHILTWTLIRYRLPIDAVLVLFAGLAIVELIEKVERYRSVRARAV